MKRFMSMFLVIALLFLAVPSVGFAAVTDEELEGYLNENNITREQLDGYLDMFDSTLDEFDTLEELDEYVIFLNEVAYDDITYLNLILEFFEVTHEELDALLAENNKSVSDFIFYEELDMYLWENYEWDLDWDEEWPEEPYYDGLFQEFGFTYKELDNLFNHLFKIVEADPNTVEKLSSLADRMEAFDGFESATELTAEEIAEMFSIGTALIDVLKLDAKFYLAKPGEQKSISFADLLDLKQIEGYDLLVVLYDLDGEELADFIITADMFNGRFLNEAGTEIDEAGKETEEAVNNPAPAPAPPAKTKAEKEEKVAKVDKTAPAKQSEPKKDNTSSKKVTKTVDGAKMPKTATDYPMYTFIGLGMTLVGFILFRRFKMAS
ncbi:processed acidic surface protein [Alkalicoccobacillus gibsonii]|uniref:processed acidic surface protein n=1 Tax=Alkalicoccobacillus gibsonii TaxID=79881 RepID=UPI003F7B381E